MADCHKLFLEFNSIIELKPNHKAFLRTSRDAVRDRIRSYFKEKANGFFPKFHGQGSFMMNIIILPSDGEFDIDDGIYFLVDKEPIYSVDTFHRWICEAVDGHTKQEPIDKQTCIRVVYAGQYHLDLPIYYIIKGQYPRLAHKSKGWIESDPREFIKWFQDKTDDKRQLRRVVRYLKAWSDYKAGSLPSGLILSILATRNIHFNARDDIALYNTLIGIKNSLALSFTCYRPTTPTYEDLLQNYSQTDKNYFKSQLISLIRSAEKALDDKTSLKNACKEWQKHFGDRFPCHLAEDNADELLSAAFTAQNLTFPNRPLIPKKPGGFA
ncbi:MULTISPECIES: cyclic GMP-AMP synthase DncV-like nucleotidyltransferase [Cyanophyceae]|uniref:cyclic GMP-AMP synthase DncV-like nucleotidyltransferase n=1 Tax=Cyanophyceae TaxID=3028117 RepID=UPI0002A6610B|nr:MULTISPECIES: hypothetical protein [Cyanophyceae]AFZ33580.1 hypothetical protein Glo7428_5202 [Gloeocapsa sp. PCC 7428]PPS42082.1 hypothetical protein B1A85_16630 [Chroococcidiopsis sp. TS-821]